MKIYTKTGDDGTTGLFGAGRVSKDHSRIEAIGAVDEINAAVGCAAALSKNQPQISALLAKLQHDLFDVGADLATPVESRAATQRITARHVDRLEQAIDEMETPLERLKYFVLPGGTPLAASLHLARVICRRAERRVVALQQEETLNTYVVHYMNRLSDLLFVLARRANHNENTQDVRWIPSDDI